MMQSILLHDVPALEHFFANFWRIFVSVASRPPQPRNSLLLIQKWSNTKKFHNNLVLFFGSGYRRSRTLFLWIRTQKFRKIKLRQKYCLIKFLTFFSVMYTNLGLCVEEDKPSRKSFKETFFLEMLQKQEPFQMRTAQNMQHAIRLAWNSSL